MIWLTWRQHRGQILVLAVGLLVLGALLLLTGRPMHDAFADTGLDECLRTQGDPAFVPVTGEGGCIELAEAFASRFFNERLLALVAFILLPVMAGMFLGAPVVARELEQGTHQLVWTQGVSRTRWAVTKLVMLSLILLAVAGLFALMVEWWFEPLNRATGDRFTWLIFDQQGSVLAGYALFAFALGVLAGAVTRRTVRAMGITLASFFVVRFAVAVWIRPHYLGTLERTYPLSINRMPNPFRSDFVIGGGGPGIGGIYDAAGRFIKGWPDVLPAADASRVRVRVRARRLQPGDLPTGEPVLALPGHRDVAVRRDGGRAPDRRDLVDPAAPHLNRTVPERIPAASPSAAGVSAESHPKVGLAGTSPRCKDCANDGW